MKKAKTEEDKAWELLEATNLSLTEKIGMRTTFANAYKEEYPFVARDWKRKEEVWYKSEIEIINHYRFYSENEVILANAIYENTKDNFNPNVFAQQLKYTFRILGVDSVWARRY